MQSMRRSRSVLVELMIAVLFLAIAACVLAQLFAAAWETGTESRHTQVSLLLARDALERFTAGEDLPAEWTRSMDGQDYVLKADVTEEKAPAGMLHTCCVTVGCGRNEHIALETTRYTMEAQQDESL